MSGRCEQGSSRVAEVVAKYGGCLELVSMDPHFHGISVGLCARDGVATVPRQVPLPKLLARALALCSGEAPRLVPGTGIGLRAYPSVPHPVFEVVAAKLHQDRPKPLPGEEGEPA